jgi:hypothetical protein
VGSECNDRGSVRARKLLPEVNHSKVKLPLTNVLKSESSATRERVGPEPTGTQACTRAHARQPKCSQKVTEVKRITRKLQEYLLTQALGIPDLKRARTIRA